MGWQIRIGVFVAMALVATAACYFFPNAGVDPEAGLIMWLPEETMEYQGERVAISRLEAQLLPEDTTYLKMSYSPKFGLLEEARIWDGLSATLILSGTDRRSLHEPEICLDNQGWAIMNRQPIKVQTSGGELEVMDLELRRYLISEGKPVLDQDGNRAFVQAHYVYWWVSKTGSTAHTDKRVLQTVRDNFLYNTNSRWGYPSVMAYADPRLEPGLGSERARSRALKFIADYAPKFQKSLGARLEGDVVEKGSQAPSSLTE